MCDQIGPFPVTFKINNEIIRKGRPFVSFKAGIDGDLKFRACSVYRQIADLRALDSVLLLRVVRDRDFSNGRYRVARKNPYPDLRRQVSQVTKLPSSGGGAFRARPIPCLTPVYPKAQLFLVERFHISWSELARPARANMTQPTGITN